MAFILLSLLLWALDTRSWQIKARSRATNALNAYLRVQVQAPVPRVSFVLRAHEHDLKADSKGFNLLFTDSLEECTGRRLQFDSGSKVPVWLWGRGSLLRNGPGRWTTDKRKYLHLFDGLAKLTKYKFSSDGSVEFSTSFIKSEWYNKTVAGNTLPPSVTTGPVSPPFNLLESIQSVLFSTQFDNVPVNVHQLGGKEGIWVGITDAPVAVEFDPTTLSTKSRVVYQNPISSLGGQELFSTAHPQTDKEGRTVNYFLELNVVKGNDALIVRTDSSLRREVIGRVPVGPIGIPYVHDISITDNYAVLCIWPLRTEIGALVTGKGFLPQLEWKPKEQRETKIYLFDLNAASSGGSLAPISTFHAPALFAYHHINAFEKDESGQQFVVFDVSGYDSPAIVNGANGFAYLDNVKDPVRRQLQERDAKWYRFELPVVTPDKQGVVVPRELLAVDEHGKEFTSELVTINPIFARKPYRYSYGFTGFADPGNDQTTFLEWAIVKLDHHQAASSVSSESPREATVKIWKQPGCYPSEPIFVPRDSGASSAAVDCEDDGVLLSQVLDGTRGESFLLVLDAASMTELGRCYVGMACPASFHGLWAEGI